MYNRKTTVELRVNKHLKEYVDFLRAYHGGIEELVLHDLTQPFRASFNTYTMFERNGFPEGVRIMPLYLSVSETIRDAIDLYREGNESDEYVLQRILYDHFQLEQPNITRGQNND